MVKKWYKRASCKQQTKKQKKRAEEKERWARFHVECESEAAEYNEQQGIQIGEDDDMKLKIQNTAWIGDPTEI